MAQIIRFPRDKFSLDEQEIGSMDSAPPSVEKKPVAGNVSTGSSATPWVQTLQDCLAALDVVARGLTGPSRGRLREEIRLLSARLATAEDALNQNLRELLVLRPDVTPNLVVQSGKSMQRRDQVADDGVGGCGVPRDSEIRSRHQDLRNLLERTGIRT